MAAYRCPMDDEPGAEAPPAARPLRGMIDPALHRPAGPPPSEPAPSQPPGRPRSSGSGDLLLDGPDLAATDHSTSHTDDRPDDHTDDQTDDHTDELRVDVAPTAMMRLLRAARLHPGRTLALVIALALVLSAVITVRSLDRDRRVTFSQSQVMAAMSAFRPPSSSSSIRSVGPDPATGPSLDVVTVSPKVCTPLVSLRPDGVIGGAEWIDVSGPTYDSTQLQILRFTSPKVARSTLDDLADRLPGCRSVDISYAEGGDPEAQTLTPDPDSSADSRFGYRTEVVGSYFYDVRQFGNTVIWVYGSGASSRAVRNAAATDLVAELRRMAEN